MLKKIKFNDWLMKIDPLLWIGSVFDCINVLVHDNQVDSNVDSMNDSGCTNKKLFVKKPVEIC